jgi:nitroreductase
MADLAQSPIDRNHVGMDLKAAIYTRRATRSFTHQALNETTIRQLIDAAVQAPSAVNRQAAAFCVVRDRALLDHISQAAKAHTLKTSTAAASHHFEQMLNDASFHIFYQAPALIVISAIGDSPWNVEDCSLAAQNLMLMARGLHLGSCWIGFAQAWLGTQEGKAALGLPEDHMPIAPIIIGHPQADPPAVPRRAPEIRWVGS